MGKFQKGFHCFFPLERSWEEFKKEREEKTNNQMKRLKGRVGQLKKFNISSIMEGEGRER